MKIYFKASIAALLTMTHIGFILPFLFSAPSDLAMLAGIALTISTPILMYCSINWIIKGIEHELD